MYHQALNALVINVVLVSTLLTYSLTSLTQACPSKTKAIGQTQPTYDDDSDTVNVRPGGRSPRFRRGVVVEQEIDEEDGLTTPASISSIEVFHELDLDSDDEVSVIEWSLEGGSVSDFWALLTRHDNNGDEVISRDEFAPVQVRILY